MTKQITLGIVAPVDAGKTTLSEALLYQAGTIHRLGRVDHQDSFLDPGQLEKKRGITISVHQAQLTINQLAVTLLDTPGHVDFADTTEQVLNVLDYAILVLSATDGVTGAGQYLWQMLAKAQVPTIIFVNKVDAPGVDQAALLTALQQKLSPNRISFAGAEQGMTTEVADNVEAVDDDVLADYLETGQLADSQVQQLFKQRKAFPVLFGAALHQDGVGQLLSLLNYWTVAQHLGSDFAATCFKISHSTNGERLTWLRVTGGLLHAKDELLPGQKADQVRVYNGSRYQTFQTVSAGRVCAITGPTSTYAGMGLGQQVNQLGTVKPVLEYAVHSPQELAKVKDQLVMIADESPSTTVYWQPENDELKLAVTGTVQREIIEQRMAAVGLPIELTAGQIIYKETITRPVEGVGHFEPLRHYAEVHVLLEPAPRGTGIQLVNHARVEDLRKNWQSQIMSALGTKQHQGVLTGAELTDLKITLLGGRGNIVHTVGGDLREASWRAVRQGLMEIRTNGCQLLEPWYSFRLIVNNETVGRALTDLARMGGKTATPVPQGNQLTVITGHAPVAAMLDYVATVRNYTHGQGQLSLVVEGYRPCHNARQIIEAAHYDPCADLPNTPNSIFCAHGAKYSVKWDEVPATMHQPYYWQA